MRKGGGIMRVRRLAMLREVWALVRRGGIRMVVASLLMGGMCLGGSDGPYFPWANMAGIVMFVGALVITRAVDPNNI